LKLGVRIDYIIRNTHKISPPNSTALKRYKNNILWIKRRKKDKTLAVLYFVIVWHDLLFSYVFNVVEFGVKFCVHASHYVIYMYASFRFFSFKTSK
jgi:hypothetical protein